MAKPVPTPFLDLNAGALGVRPASAPRRRTKSQLQDAPAEPQPAAPREPPPGANSPAVTNASAKDESWRKQSPDERRRAIDGIFVYAGGPYETILALEDMRGSPCQGGPAHLMVVTGPTGTGKKTLLNQYANRFATRSSPRADSLTVARVVLLEPCDGRDLGFAILKGLEHPRVVRPSSIYDALDQIARQVERRETEVLGIRAGRYLCRGQQIEGTARDLLGELLDRRTVGTVALFGPPELMLAVDACERLRTYVERRIVLANLEFEDEPTAAAKRKRGLPLGRDRLTAFLAEVETKLPFRENGLAVEMMAERIFVAMGGNRRAIMLLIRLAAHIALVDDTRAATIRIEHFAAAFAKQWPDRTNPFLTETPPRPSNTASPISADLLARFERIRRLNA